MAIAAFIVGSICVAWLGSYRYVETLRNECDMVLLTRPPLLRLVPAEIFAIAITLMGVHVATAAPRVAVVHVLSRRNAGKLSWRRAAFTEEGKVDVGVVGIHFDRSDKIK
jgi:hypothetical protein